MACNLAWLVSNHVEICRSQLIAYRLDSSSTRTELQTPCAQNYLDFKKLPCPALNTRWFDSLIARARSSILCGLFIFVAHERSEAHPPFERFCWLHRMLVRPHSSRTTIQGTKDQSVVRLRAYLNAAEELLVCRYHNATFPRKEFTFLVTCNDPTSSKTYPVAPVCQLPRLQLDQTPPVPPKASVQYAAV